MKASDFRDDDIVEVVPASRDGWVTFQGVVDSQSIPLGKRRSGFDLLKWVWIRRFGDRYAGGWYPNQCRLIRRPIPDPELPIPENIVLGDA